MNNNTIQLPFSSVLSRILSADDAEISEIITAVIRRYGIVYPETEVVFLSLPKYDVPERKRIIESALKMLERH